MWTVIYVSQSQEIAKKLEELLLGNGIISRLRRANISGGEDKDCCEVLVPGAELEAAQDLIIENGLF